MLFRSPRLEISFADGKRPNEIIEAEEFIGVKGYTAKGKRLTTYEIATIVFIEPSKPNEEPEIEEIIEPSESPIVVDEASLFKPTDEIPEQTSLF